jgi:hypothetical protein
MPFNATCVPGADAGAAVQVLGRIQQLPAVVIYFDPDRLVIGPPASPAEWPVFLEFLRDLTQAVDKLAEYLDPKAESVYYEPLVVAANPPGVMS